MFENKWVVTRLETVLGALERIIRRFSDVGSADDFLDSDYGIDKLDAICMVLMATGEAFKQIDRKTNGELLERYPQIDWKGVERVVNSRY